LQGALPDDSRARDDGIGVVFRVRLIEKTGRFVTRSAPILGNDVRPSLAAIDLRGDDEANWPSPWA
jgi:hypothetical protein